MPDRSIRRVLAACRGEAALRILRSARAGGIETVVLFSARDAEAEWVEAADYAVYVPDEPEAWPSVERVVSAGVDAGCDAVHPGWGALCRSAWSAELVVRSGMAWLGPSLPALEAVSDRTAQRAAAAQLEIPMVPGSDPVTESLQVHTWMAWAGAPALLKPIDTLGLPGRSVRIDDAEASAELIGAVLADGPAILERLVLDAREIEIPVLAGVDGRVAALGDRETTVRSGHDRLLVESPAAGLSDDQRAAMRDHAVRLATRLGWRGLGAVRFLLTGDGRAWFLGLRPGLTPWHAATEVALGLDLVETELHLASGAHLGWESDDLLPVGHAITVRVPVSATATVTGVVEPADVAVQAAAVPGDVLEAGELCGSVTVRAPTRQAALVRARAVLDRWPVQGVPLDDVPLRALLDDPGFWQAPVHRERAAALTGLGERALPGRRDSGAPAD